MNAAKWFAFLILSTLLGSCTSTPLWHINPALPSHAPCTEAKIYLDPGALSLQHSQEFLYHSEELDLVKDSLSTQLQSLGLLPLPLSDSALGTISRPWSSQLWFRARWPLYRGLDSAAQSILIHRLDLGSSLQPSLLYGANFSTSEEGETDTLSPSQRIYPKQIQVWTCMSLWDNTRAQYRAYGCFPFEFQGPGTPWDSTLHQAHYWKSWLQTLRSRACS